MDDLHKTYHDYNRKYHMNRLMYKEYLNKKLANAWNKRLQKSGDQDIENASNQSASSFLAKRFQETPTFTLDTDYSVKSRKDHLDTRGFHQFVEENGKQMFGKHLSSRSCLSEPEDVAWTSKIRSQYSCRLPKTTSGSGSSKEKIKAQRARANVVNRTTKKALLPLSLPHIHQTSSLVSNAHFKGQFNATTGLSEVSPASSTMNSFGYFTKIKEPGTSVLRNVEPNLTSIRNTGTTSQFRTHDSLINSSDLLNESIELQIDVFHTSLDLTSENYSLTKDHCNQSEHKCSPRNSKLQASAKTFVDETRNKENVQVEVCKETVHEEVCKEKVQVEVCKETIHRPAKALHKVIFRTKDETGVLVVTAIGINEAALLS
ncbi:hypothetical protein BgiBS90_015227 [Biomphalaria glabrata]|nr:hypothetical protein BgiBS90_015227 [Biomphalaria glabrata]